MRHRVMRRVLTACLACCLLSGMAAVAMADSGSPLVIQRVGVDEYPRVDLSIVLPAELLASGSTPEFSVTENGEEVEHTVVAATEVTEDPVDVVLVIDVSGSMEGEALASAKEAARAFFGGLDDPNRVAVVDFSTQARVAQTFTSDDAALQRAVDGLDAGGETAVYDALVTASDLIASSPLQHGAIVLLSDGGDTMSRTTFDAMLNTLRDRGAPVFSVALSSAEEDHVALQTIAANTGGRLMTVSDLAALPASFEGIARELQDRWTVTYTSLKPDTVDLEIDVAASAGDVSAAGSILAQNPAFATAAELDPWEPTRSPAADYLGLGVAAGLSFASVGLLVLGVLLIVLRPRNALGNLRYYEQLRSTSGDLPTADDVASATLTDRMVEAVGYVAGQRGMTAMVHQWLERAGLPLRPVEYITGHLVLVVFAGAVVQLLSANLAASIMVIVVATAAPMLWIQHLVNRRSRLFEEQLPEVLNLIAGSLRSGWGMQQAVDMVVREMAAPSSEEFRRVETEARLGMPIEESLLAMAERLDSDDFRWAVSAITIQREVGGNLAEVLDIVAGTIRERAALHRHIDSLTAEGRLSAAVLLGLPFLEVFVLLVVNPSYISALFTTGPGLMLTAFGVMLLLVGGVWLRNAISVEV